MDSTVDQSTNGILRPNGMDEKFSLTRYSPSTEVGYFVKHYWIVRWDLRGQPPYEQIVLSHPNVTMVFEPQQARVYGIAPTTSKRLLLGQGWAVGAKFKAGGFFPFWGKPMSELTGSSIDTRDIFGTDSSALREAIYAVADGERAARLVDEYLQEHLPARDPNAELADRIVRGIRDDRSIVRSQDAAQLAEMSLRSLQRLFDRYVGVSPKWVIQRYRLHEAAERAARETQVNWTELSLELGYYDQSHFIRDFKAVVGVTPEEYARANG